MPLDPWGPYGARPALLADRLAELSAVEVGVEAAAGEQLVVGAALDDAPVPDREDQVGVPDRAQAVRDHDARPSLQEPGERLLYHLLRPGVYVARRLVQYEDARVG